MATRARRAPSRAADPSGGNVLFTLGLVSVVALLIVGYIMTNGGMNASTPSSGNESLFVTSTPTPEPVTPPAGGGMMNSMMMEQLEKLKEQVSTLQENNQQLNDELAEVKTQKNKEIENLKLRIQTLMLDNKRMEKELYGEN